jgi:two-component sensor histidine kinase
MAGPAEATRAEAGEDRFHAFAWDRTPVGPVERWPQSLRAAVDLMLGFGAPSALFVGPTLVQMHNLAFRALYRDEHAAGRALGRSVNREEPGGAVSAAAEAVFAGRSLAFHGQDSPLDSGAGGKTFNLSYAPVRDEHGQVCAMLMLALPAAEPPTRARGPLVGELQHRVRNILAVVRSVVARSAETSDTVEDLAAGAGRARARPSCRRRSRTAGEGRASRPERRR